MRQADGFASNRLLMSVQKEEEVEGVNGSFSDFPVLITDEVLRGEGDGQELVREGVGADGNVLQFDGLV